MAVFHIKVNFFSKEVCYKVSLCENFQPQSCKARTSMFWPVWWRMQFGSRSSVKRLYSSSYTDFLSGSTSTTSWHSSPTRFKSSRLPSNCVLYCSHTTTPDRWGHLQLHASLCRTKGLRLESALSEYEVRCIFTFAYTSHIRCWECEPCTVRRLTCSPPLPSNRQHPSINDCLQDRRNKTAFQSKAKRPHANRIHRHAF